MWHCYSSLISCDGFNSGSQVSHWEEGDASQWKSSFPSITYIPWLLYHETRWMPTSHGDWSTIEQVTKENIPPSESSVSSSNVSTQYIMLIKMPCHLKFQSVSTNNPSLPSQNVVASWCMIHFMNGPFAKKLRVASMAFPSILASQQPCKAN